MGAQGRQARRTKVQGRKADWARRGGWGWEESCNLASLLPNPIQSNLIRRIACSAQQYKVGSALCPRALGVITLTFRCRPTSVFPL